MKLLARLVLAAAGGVYLPAVLAGRLAAARDADYAGLLVAEAVGGSLGIAVAWAVVSLGRRRRPAAAKIFSDLVCLGLGVLWLVALWAGFTGASQRVWDVTGWLWTSLATVALVVWMAARAAWEPYDARAVTAPAGPRRGASRARQKSA